MSEINAEKMAAELAKRGHEWADKDAAHFFLDETTKSVLSECIADINSDMAHNAKEAQARRSPKYMEHIEALTEARRAMNHAKVSYDACKAYMELRRSEEATTRASMTLR